MAWVCKRTIPIDATAAVGEPTFAYRGCHVVSVLDPYGHILGFVDRCHYFFSQIAPQLYSQGWVDPLPDPLFLRKSGGARNRTQAPGSVAGNSDHWTTEAIGVEMRKFIFVGFCVTVIAAFRQVVTCLVWSSLNCCVCINDRSLGRYSSLGDSDHGV
jgi:hypothetical protein